MSMNQKFNDGVSSQNPLMRLPFISAIAVCLLGSCSLAQAQSLARVQAQSQAQAQTHAQIQAQVQVQAQVQAQAQAQTQAQVQSQAQIQSRTQSQAPAHTQTQTPADAQGLGPAQLIPAFAKAMAGRHTHTHPPSSLDFGGHGTHTQSVHCHLIWDQLLQQFVSETGLVNYSGIKQNISQLDQYLGQLQTNPVLDSWSRDQKLAYWINAYNAFTIKLIVDHYPVKSIRDIQNPWDKKFIRLGDQMFSLNQIENQIIRPGFKEPRVHFALVCAAVSCPKLLNQAYLPQKLDEQLDQQTRYFINESGKNKLSPNLVGLSKLFSWYGTDFTNEGTLIDFINQYSEQPISDNAKIKYLEYSWDLND